MSLINTAITGIRAAQLGLSTTGHNIVNADTEGYTRQSVVNETGTPMRTGAGYMGTGVVTTDVIRSTEKGLVDRVNADTSTLAGMDAFLSNISKVDNLFAGDSTNLSAAMNRFFDSVNEAANDPSSMIGRSLMLSESKVMVDSFRDVEQRLRDQNQAINTRLKAIAGEVTTLARGLAEMNRSISFAASGDQGQPNDLLDKRDQMVRELSAYVEVDTVERGDGTMDITIGQGQPLVTGLKSRELVTQPAGGDSSRVELAFVDGRGTEPAGRSLQGGGEIGGLLRFRDDVLEPAMNQVGRLILGVADNLNAQHQMGMDLEGNLGGPLFTDINDPALATGRISEFPHNSGSSRSMNVQITDTSQLANSSYELSFSGPNGRYSVVRRTDGEVVAEGILTEKRPETISLDGFDINIESGSFQSGDRFGIQPTRFAASNLQTLVSRPEALALASPIRTAVADGNSGGATLSAGQVSSTETAAFADGRRLDPPVMIRFTSPTTYDVLDYSDPANPKPLDPPLMDQPFTPGATTNVFPSDPGGTTVSSLGAAAQQLQIGQTTNGYGPENLTVQTIDPGTGFLNEQFLSVNADESARDIAARLSALDGVKATARSTLQLTDFQSGTNGNPMTLSLNGVDLTDPTVVLPGESSPQEVPDPLTPDFLRDRINNNETLKAQGIYASSDGNTLTIRSSRGDDLNVTLDGSDGQVDVVGSPNQTVDRANPADPPTEFVVGGRVDVQLASDMRLFSDDPNGLFGGAPEAKSNYTGYQVTLGSGTGEQGQPAAGDRLFVEYNSGGSADNRNAVAMLDLNTANTLAGGNLTYQETYGQLVEDVGIQTSQARQSQQASESMLRQSMDAWSSMSGVNIEEEAARLIQLEQHYNASARLISLASELFDTLLNM